MNPNTLLAAARRIYPPGSQYTPILNNGKVLLKDTKRTISSALEFPSLVFSLSNKSWLFDLLDTLMKDPDVIEYRYEGGEYHFIYQDCNRECLDRISGETPVEACLEMLEALEAMK